MVAHLVGLQAQENLPPYLSLAARLESFDPYAVSRGLEDRSLVRLLTMRGTIHLLVPDDALTLRGLDPAGPRARAQGQPEHPSRAPPPAGGGPRRRGGRARGGAAAGEGTRRGDGRAPARRARRTPLAHLARVDVPLVQLPPRGCWQQSGGVVYERVDRWLGRPLVEPDPAAVVRRYLTAFGPATAADVTAWSGVTRLGPVVGGMDDLVRHEDGRRATGVRRARRRDRRRGRPGAAVRLLGTYDNVWLSHAGRDRVTAPDKRTAWMGSNGGVASTVFVDGMLEGLWRLGGRPRPRRAVPGTDPAGDVSELDDEIARVEELARPQEVTPRRARTRTSAARSDTSARQEHALGGRRQVQRGVRASRAATAATPAVEVRSTSAPRRTERGRRRRRRRRPRRR